MPIRASSLTQSAGGEDAFDVDLDLPVDVDGGGECATAFLSLHFAAFPWCRLRCVSLCLCCADGSPLITPAGFEDESVASSDGVRMPEGFYGARTFDDAS